MGRAARVLRRRQRDGRRRRGGLDTPRGLRSVRERVSGDSKPHWRLQSTHAGTDGTRAVDQLNLLQRLVQHSKRHGLAMAPADVDPGFVLIVLGPLGEIGFRTRRDLRGFVRRITIRTRVLFEGELPEVKVRVAYGAEL
jgi:hypothetical protein